MKDDNLSRTAMRKISGFGRYPVVSCRLVRPEKYTDLHCYGLSSIARGQGKSYGDASLNSSPEGIVVLTDRLNRFLVFDKIQGILSCEAGVTLKEILDVIVPAGWFLPVTPGTQYATLGGCIAADVHGKNHHQAGTLGQYILSIELITADHQKISCNPEENKELFWATIGGMGLTGIIGTATVKLKAIASDKMRVFHQSAHNLSEIFDLFSDSNLEDEYSVAWIDTLSEGRKQGRGIMMRAHHATRSEISSYTHDHERKNKINLKNICVDFPEFLLNKYSIRYFNEYYFRRQSSEKYKDFVTSYQRYFYPLDNFLHWNRLYGKRGFVQYQCVLPEHKSLEGISEILKLKPVSFLSVLKKMGDAGAGLLSFPLKGYTLAMDIPFRGQETLDLLKRFDDIVVAYSGRIYLAKDACLSSEYFRKMYPRYAEWLKIKKVIDPDNYFYSDLSRRLKIGEEDVVA